MIHRIFAVFLFTLLALVGNVRADELFFAGTSTDISTNISYYVVPPAGNQQAVVTYINATSDLAGSVVQFYNAAAPVKVSAAAASTNVQIASITGLSTGGVVIVQSVTNNTFQRTTVVSFSATNVILSATNVLSALVAGDKIYPASTAGAIPVGAATKEVVGASFVSQGNNRPLLVEVNGTAAAGNHINAISGTYK
jgi:hypothetical protein